MKIKYVSSSLRCLLAKQGDPEHNLTCMTCTTPANHITVTWNLITVTLWVLLVTNKVLHIMMGAIIICMYLHKIDWFYQFLGLGDMIEINWQSVIWIVFSLFCFTLHKSLNTCKILNFNISFCFWLNSNLFCAINYQHHQPNIQMKYTPKICVFWIQMKFKCLEQHF